MSANITLAKAVRLYGKPYRWMGHLPLPINNRTIVTIKHSEYFSDAWWGEVGWSPVNALEHLIFPCELPSTLEQIKAVGNFSEYCEVPDAG